MHGKNMGRNGFKIPINAIIYVYYVSPGNKVLSKRLISELRSKIQILNITPPVFNTNEHFAYHLVTNICLGYIQMYVPMNQPFGYYFARYIFFSFTYLFFYFIQQQGPMFAGFQEPNNPLGNCTTLYTRVVSTIQVYEQYLVPRYYQYVLCILRNCIFTCQDFKERCHSSLIRIQNYYM